MANVLVQIRGTKRLLLFPPSDVQHLQIPAGASSSRLNVFDPATSAAGLLKDTHPQEVNLRPGEILFIPPFWLHAAEPTESISVAVNVFFRDLDSGYAAGRDVYGNRDLQAYEEGRRELNKMVQRFQGLPRSAAKFYMQRLALEMLEEVDK